jgi:uncharacterized membrane protein
MSVVSAERILMRNRILNTLWWMAFFGAIILIGRGVLYVWR